MCLGRRGQQGGSRQGAVGGLEGGKELELSSPIQCQRHRGQTAADFGTHSQGGSTAGHPHHALLLQGRSYRGPPLPLPPALGHESNQEKR